MFPIFNNYISVGLQQFKQQETKGFWHSKATGVCLILVLMLMNCCPLTCWTKLPAERWSLIFAVHLYTVRAAVLWDLIRASSEMKAGGLLLSIKKAPSYTNKARMRTHEDWLSVGFHTYMVSILNKKLLERYKFIKIRSEKARGIMGNWFLLGGIRQPRLSQSREEAPYCS